MSSKKLQISRTHALRRFEISKDGAAQRSESENPAEEWPTVSRQVKAIEEIDKLVKGEDSTAEKSKKARGDYRDTREKIEKKFSRREQLP